MVNHAIRDKLDAQAQVCYRLSSILRKHDPVLSKYIEDIGKAYQANDKVAKLRTMRLIEQHLASIPAVAIRR